MYTLHLAATKSTPEIHFDPAQGHCSVRGMSTPENAAEFYQPLIHWMDLFLRTSVPPVVLRFDLSYFNSSSLKAIYLLLARVREAQIMGTSIRVIWVVEDDDEFMLESSEYFSELLGLSMEIERVPAEGRDHLQQAS